MKRGISFIVLIAGMILWSVSKFILQPGNVADWVMRIAGVTMIIGIAAVSYFTAKEVKRR